MLRKYLVPLVAALVLGGAAFLPADALAQHRSWGGRMIFPRAFHGGGFHSGGFRGPVFHGGGFGGPVFNRPVFQGRVFHGGGFHRRGFYGGYWGGYGGVWPGLYLWPNTYSYVYDDDDYGYRYRDECYWARVKYYGRHRAYWRRVLRCY
jgi:hypothetical protein